MYATPTAEILFPEEILVVKRIKEREPIEDPPISLGLQKRVRAAQARRQREFESVLFYKKQNKKLLKDVIERRNTVQGSFTAPDLVPQNNLAVNLE